MKKFIVIILIVLLIPVSQNYIVPNVVSSAVSSIYYVSPETSLYKNIVNSAGTIISSNRQRIHASSAYKIDKINVKTGDSVKKGDVLFTTVKNEVEVNYNIGSINETDIKNYVLNAIVEEVLSEQPSISGIIGDKFGTSALTPEKLVSVSPVYNQVKSPIDGIVTEMNINEGLSVFPGRSLINIEDNSSFSVIANVNENDIHKIKIGDKGIIRGVAFSDFSYSGTVKEIAPTAKRIYSGTSYETVVEVLIDIDDADSSLRSGFSAKVEISGEDYFDVLAIPYEAIRQDNNHNEYVYVYEDGKIKKSNIIVGRELVDVVEILDGITKESIVIYNPDDIPHEGAIVNIKGRADKV